MGSDAEGVTDIERPKHSVHVPAFWIYRTPVTNGQYQRCIAASACEGVLPDHPDNDYPAEVTYLDRRLLAGDCSALSRLPRQRAAKAADLEPSNGLQPGICA